MSVISIRPAQESLRNLGNVRMPDRMPRFVAPDRSGQKAMARSIGDLGQGIGRVGEAMLRFATAAKREDEDRRLAAAGAEYQRRLQEGFLEGDDPLMARQGDALEGDGLKQTQADTEQLFRRSFDESCAQYGIDGRLKERFALHCAPVALSWNGRMDGHVLAERKKNGIAAADKLVERDEQDWAGDKYNAALTQKLIDDYDHKLKVRGMTEDVRAAEVRKYALGLAVDVGRSSFDGIDSEGAFDEKIRLVKEDPDGLFNDNDELLERLGKNALPEKTVELLVDDLKQRKAKFVLEQTRAVNAEVDVLVAEGDLGKMDKGVDDLKTRCESLPEDSKVRAATLEAAAKLDKYADEVAGEQVLTDYLDRLNDDPDYRIWNAETGVADAYKGDPRKERLAMGLQDKVDRERMKQNRAQAAANADEISAAFNRLLVRKMNGDITQAEAATEQARIWSRFMECTIGGSIPGDFMKSFRNEFGRELNEQQASAMGKLYAAFGYTGELDSSGSVPKLVQKSDSTDYYAPSPDGTKEGDRPKVGAKDLFAYGASLLRALETADPKMDREALIEGEINRAKTDWIKRGFFDSRRENAARNTEAALRNVMDVQREMRTRWEMARPERRSKDDDRRDEDRDSAK